MGGGDLNLKKSWHPTTLRNMERVWKAEQKHEAECKKIEELQKELQEERDREDIRHYAEEKGVVKKKADRLDWMYEGATSQVNREEYLLGRNVDKTFELLQQTESGISSGDFKTEGDTMPESILKNTSKGGNVTIDLANKIRQDPLFVIKKQEEQSRKDLLENPVRMKQLRQMLQQATSHKDKKNKKHRRKRIVSDDHSEKSGRRKVKKHKHSNRSDSSSERMDKLIHHIDKKKHPADSNFNKNSQHHHKRRLLSHTSNRTSVKPIDTDTEERSHRKHRRNSTDSKPTVLNAKTHGDKVNTKYESNQKKRRHSPESFHEIKKTRKLDAAEREKRLKEMLSNAQWSDQQRHANMRHYINESKAEEKMKKTGQIEMSLLNQVAQITSVESRIKSNIYNIQRTKADLEKSFTKR